MGSAVTITPDSSPVTITPDQQQQPESASAYVKRVGGPVQTTGKSPAELAWEDIKAGNYAEAVHRTATSIGSAMTPLLAPAAVAAPVATAASIGGGMLGQYALKKGASAMGLSPAQSDVAGDVGAIAGGVGGGVLGSRLPGTLLPSTQKAGIALEDVKATVGDVPINVSKPGDTALQLYEQSQRGAVLPKSVRQLVMRLTDPNADPITYAEAKDFQSNISALSVNERLSLKPNTARLVGQLNADLKDSLQGAADTAGKGQQFAQAMKDYHNAMQIKGMSEAAKDALWKAAFSAAGLYGVKKVLDKGAQ